ncbi:MAG: hypothetical protein IJ731_09035 [Eubacterium sp.]|nr:hypothetical protein [Eubacterium sp.]
MFNLPKPSPLSMKGNSNDKCNYLVNYLQKLVTELEKALGGVKRNNQSEGNKVVAEISKANNSLIISYTDGSKKTITL